MRQPWTEEENRYLVDHYATDTLHAIAAHLGRSFESVQVKSYGLQGRGMLSKHNRAYNPPWTEEQEDYLNDRWGVLSDATVAGHIGRSVTACKMKAKRVGIARRMNVWTTRNVGDLFGVDAKTVKRWIERGWITARRAGFAMGPNRIWNVDDDSIESFVRTMGWAYDLSRMIEGERLTRLAIALHKADPWLTVDEAAALLGLHERTVRRWCHKGLPFHYRPKQSQRGPREGIIVIQRSQLRAFVERHQESARRNRSEAAKARCRRYGRFGANERRAA